MYVRVDNNTKRIIGLSANSMVSRTGKPVFEVDSIDTDIEYYIVSPNDTDEGCEVRPVTDEERVVVDERKALRLAASVVKKKYDTTWKLFEKFNDGFVSQVGSSVFKSILEVLAAANYTGTDALCLDRKTEAQATINNFNMLRWHDLQDALVAVETDTAHPLIDSVNNSDHGMMSDQDDIMTNVISNVQPVVVDTTNA